LASSTIDLSARPDPDSFPAKSVLQRMAIVVAGPLANFVFAIIALALLFATVGRPFTPAEVGEVQADSPAAAAGLVPGDRIIAVDGDSIESFEELQTIVRSQPEEILTFTIERAGESSDVQITPGLSEIEDRFGNVHRIGLIGVSRSGVEFRRTNPVFALVEGTSETVRMIGGTLYALGEMIVGSRTTEELGGPLRIAQMSGEIAKDGAVPMIWFTAVLSINLGLINLFPIPMLDGGHLLMYAIEGVRGRPLTERSQEVAFRFGLVLVITLMMVATWNDLVQLNVIEFVKGLVS
jgi:regulator of sigma E protease